MRGTAVLLLLAALATPAAGDTVHLANGNKFEEVVAEEGAGVVRILMPDGEIVLPARVVARVERSPSAWQEFGARERRLLEAGSPAAAWLELARWADRAGYPRGMRQASLRAAALAPQLAGLAPLMARIGHVRDAETGEWLAEADYMRRRGYLLWGESWLPREEHAARLEAHRAAEERRREEARQERITRALEALVVAQLRRPAEPVAEPQPVAARAPLVAVYSGGFFPFGLPVASAPVVAGQQPATYDDVARRQPGSLFPIRGGRRLTGSD